LRLSFKTAGITRPFCFGSAQKRISVLKELRLALGTPGDSRLTR
jgi:hypothetical protein